MSSEQNEDKKKSTGENNPLSFIVPPSAPPSSPVSTSEPPAPPLEESKVKVEVKAGLPDDAKKPDPKTGKTFDLLSAESKAEYKRLGFTIEEKQDDKSEPFLVLKKDDSTHEVHRWYITTKVSEGELSEAAKLNLKNVANTVMASMKKAGKAPYVWVESENSHAQAFLTKYYQDNNFTITPKPKNIDLPRPEPTKAKEKEPEKENTENTSRIKPMKS